MEKKISFSEILKKYTMVLVLVLVVIMFAVNTKGVMLLPQNVNNLVAQNAYVFLQVLPSVHGRDSGLHM